MPQITNENDKLEINSEQENNVQQLNTEKEIEVTDSNGVNDVEEKKEETVAVKAIKEAKEKIANEVKEQLKNINGKATDTEKKLQTNKKVIEKEETVIQKIKNFIAKIIEMQEETEGFEEEETSSQLDNSDGETKNTKKEKTDKSKYIVEYYDLPYRYNDTVVKILAQTPKRLFVYWDISDEDRKKYETAFGERFFEETYPVLLVHNVEKNYTFEVPINDFANSWYLDIQDPKSKYVIQLGRKFRYVPKDIEVNSINKTYGIELQNDYIPITTSNTLEVPNDRILFESIGDKALYKNVKTGEESYIKTSNSEFVKKIGKIYNIYDLYKEIYKNEIGNGSLTDLLNPSSMTSSNTNSSIFR